MEMHYNAFISYRHHPDDIRVAKQIHQLLERFKVPRALKEQGKEITRLFRDKEELPITSRLTDDIGKALENSDFLIVICSPHTKESIWVQREIETFLQTHDRSHVLTVLASGEPYEVIPECLLYETVTDPVTGEETRRQLEPLSCDWRMKKSKAVREELPRLAAALLGCAYDELRQRQRQYRMRRMVALFSAALVVSVSLMIYFISTSIRIQRANEQLAVANVEIRENLNEALRNESQYLATRASELLDEGNRLLALFCAYAGLPSELGERPYVPAAELVLNKALNAYCAEEKIMAKGAFNTTAIVQDFLVTSDDAYIYISDAKGLVSVFDTQTYLKVATVDLAGVSIKRMLLTPSDNLICITSYPSNSAVCYNKDGEKLWTVESCRDIAFYDDGTMLALQYEYTNLSRLLILDPETAQQRETPLELPEVGEGGTPSAFFQELYDADHPVLIKFSNIYVYYACLADPATGKVTVLMETDSSKEAKQIQYMDSAHIDRNGNVVVLVGDETGRMNGRYVDSEVTGRDVELIQCYDSATGRLKWEDQVVTYVYGQMSVYPVANGEQALIQIGNSFQLYDMATGKLLGQYQTPDVALKVNAYDTRATGMLRNGMFFSFSYDSDECMAISILEGKLDGAAISSNYYVHKELTTHVSVYGAVKDENGVAIEDVTNFYGYYNQLYGDLIVNWDRKTLCVVDVAQRKLCWEQEFGYNYDILGLSQDGTKIYLWQDYDYLAVTVDAYTGQYTQVPVKIEVEEHYTSLESNLFLHEDKVWYLAEYDGGIQLHRVDMATGQRELALDVPELVKEQINYSPQSRIIALADQWLWLWKDQTGIMVVSTQDGTVRQVAESSMQPVCTASGDELLITAAEAVFIAKADGTEIFRVELGEKKAVSACMHQDLVLILCNDGRIYIYDREGVYRYLVELELYNTFFSYADDTIESPMDVTWSFTDDGDLILNAFNAGNIIDCETWERKTFVGNMFAYLPHRNELICGSGELTVYKRYTLAEQMVKAQKLMGYSPIDQEQKEQYGLS